MPVGNLFWSLASQACSSATNFLLGAYVLRASTPQEFGAFGLAFAATLVIVGVARGAACNPAMLDEFSSSERRGAVALAAIIGLVGGLMCAAASLAVVPDFTALLLVSAIMPVVWSVQEAQRWSSFSSRVPQRAFLADGIWLGLFAPAFMLEGDGSLIVLAWCIAGALSVAGGSALWESSRINARFVGAYLERARRWIASMIVESTLTLALSQLSPYVVVVILGLYEYGIYRAALTILGPLVMLTVALSPITLRRFSDLAVLGAVPKIGRELILLIAALTATAVAFVASALLLPSPVLHSLFGPTSLLAYGALPFVAGQLLGLAILSVSLNAIRRLVAPRTAAAARVLVSAAEVGLLALGGAFYGLEGAAGGAALGALLPGVAIAVGVAIKGRVSSHAKTYS